MVVIEESVLAAMRRICYFQLLGTLDPINSSFDLRIVFENCVLLFVKRLILAIISTQSELSCVVDVNLQAEVGVEGFLRWVEFVEYLLYFCVYQLDCTES